jgi:hypothetical protein
MYVCWILLDINRAFNATHIMNKAAFVIPFLMDNLSAPPVQPTLDSHTSIFSSSDTDIRRRGHYTHEYQS